MSHRTTRTTRTTRRAGLAVLALTAALGLAACGSDDDGHAMAGHDGGAMGASDSPGASASSAAHTEADVAFASDMIPHHAQAVEMVRMLEGRDVSPDLARLAARIEAAQQPEITTMTGWLRQWGEPVPDASGDMGDMAGMAGMDHSTSSGMPGMMTDAEMGSLEKASGEAFEQLWISMMIRHHGGAVEMARVEVSDGSYAPAIALAKDIIESQSKEILTLRDLQRG